MTRALNRRTLIVGSLAAISFAQAASTRVWRVALITSSPGVAILNIIRTSLKSAGYEEGKNLVARRYGLLAGFVAQMGGHDTMGRRHIGREERWNVRIGGGVGKYAADEPGTQCYLVGGESRRLTKFVAFEPIGKNR